MARTAKAIPVSRSLIRLETEQTESLDRSIYHATVLPILSTDSPIIRGVSFGPETDAKNLDQIWPLTKSAAPKKQLRLHSKTSRPSGIFKAGNHALERWWIFM
jgi:hypothetical protein